MSVLSNESHDGPRRRGATGPLQVGRAGPGQPSPPALGRVEIHDVGPTPHTEHLLVTYLPEQGIVFEADHISVPQTGPLPPAITNTHALDEALTARGLRVTTIVGAHSPRVLTMDDMKAAIEKDSETRVAAQ